MIAVRCSATLIILSCALSAVALDGAWGSAVHRTLEQHGAVIQPSTATGAAHLVRLPPGGLKLAGSSPEATARDFFSRYGGVFGVVDPDRELVQAATRRDRLGRTHLEWRQVHRSVPVLGGLLRTHFDTGGALTAVNGTFVPGLRSTPSPIWPRPMRSGSPSRWWPRECWRTILCTWRAPACWSFARASCAVSRAPTTWCGRWRSRAASAFASSSTSMPTTGVWWTASQPSSTSPA